MSQLGHGRKAVTAAGTAEALDADSDLVSDVWITPLSTNTGIVVIGGPGVIAGVGTTTRVGVELTPPTADVAQSPPLHLEVDDLGKVFVDAVTSGDGVSFTYREP